MTRLSRRGVGLLSRPWISRGGAVPRTKISRLSSGDQEGDLSAIPVDAVFGRVSAWACDPSAAMLTRLEQVSRIVAGNLVINRAALASAVRNTTNYQGVTCAITLDLATGNRADDPAALERCAS